MPWKRASSMGRRRVQTAQDLMEARRRFSLSGSLPPGDVRLPIQRSWARCATFGLRMGAIPAVDVLSQRQLQEIRARNEELLRAAQGEIETLGAEARATNGIVLLADAGGTIVSQSGSIDFGLRASRVALRPGANWGEASIGTNAIGTALAEMQAACVFGAEHYFESHRFLSCSAVPIFDPIGELIGILDFSSPAAVQQTHTLALIKRAVEQIERNLFGQRFGSLERINFHCDPLLVGSPHEGLLAFEDDRLVGANRIALGLLGIEKAAIGRVRFADLFEVDPHSLLRAPTPDGTALITARGSTIFAQLQPRKVPKPLPSKTMAKSDAIGLTPAFDAQTLKLLDTAVRLADAAIPILVQGEAGIGKEVFARRLHSRSRFRDGAFVVLDCATLTEGRYLREPAARSAETIVCAALAEAEGGTLLLEEISAAAMPVQTRLLQLLQPDTAAPRSDCAVICTTSHRLAERVGAGLFREDLFSLLAGYTVELPPLRAREDRAALVQTIWQEIVTPAAAGRLAAETVATLGAYAWPGNFRQLVSTLRALAVLAEAGQDIAVATLPGEFRDLPPPVTSPQPDLDPGLGLDSITLTAMRAALAAENGNVSRAARRLGVHRSMFYRRLFSERR